MKRPRSGDLMIGTGVHNANVKIVIKESFQGDWTWAYQEAPWHICKTSGMQKIAFFSIWRKIGTACPECGDEDCDDSCLFVDGRDIEVVSEYASTCDGCAELTTHAEMEMDPVTQLGYCASCLAEIKTEGLSHHE
jgi:hypothetical protein